MPGTAGLSQDHRNVCQNDPEGQRRRGNQGLNSLLCFHLFLWFDKYFKHEVRFIIAETGKRDVPEAVVYPDPQPGQRGHDPQDPEYHRRGTNYIKS